MHLFPHIIKDQQINAEVSSKEEALELIRNYQARETHYIRSEFSIIEGKPQEFIKYPK